MCELAFSSFGKNLSRLLWLQNAAIADGKEDLSDLPPNQRRKKLMQKVEELKSKVAQETAAKDGLMKMKGVYEANPALGDPMTIEGKGGDACWLGWHF